MKNSGKVISKILALPRQKVMEVLNDIGEYANSVLKYAYKQSRSVDLEQMKLFAKMVSVWI